MGRATVLMLSMFLFSLFMYQMGYSNLAMDFLDLFSGDPGSSSFATKFAIFSVVSIFTLGVTMVSNAPILAMVGAAFFGLINLPYGLLVAEDMPVFLRIMFTGIYSILWLFAALDIAMRGNI